MLQRHDRVETLSHPMDAAIRMSAVCRWAIGFAMTNLD
jgi:hypothetical protein